MFSHIICCHVLQPVTTTLHKHGQILVVWESLQGFVNIRGHQLVRYTHFVCPEIGCPEILEKRWCFQYFHSELDCLGVSLFDRYTHSSTIFHCYSFSITLNNVELSLSWLLLLTIVIIIVVTIYHKGVVIIIAIIITFFTLLSSLLLSGHIDQYGYHHYYYHYHCHY